MKLWKTVFRFNDDVDRQCMLWLILTDLDPVISTINSTFEIKMKHGRKSFCCWAQKYRQLELQRWTFWISYSDENETREVATQNFTLIHSNSELTSSGQSVPVGCYGSDRGHACYKYRANHIIYWWTKLNSTTAVHNHRFSAIVHRSRNRKCHLLTLCTTSNLIACWIGTTNCGWLVINCEIKLRIFSFGLAIGHLHARDINDKNIN